MSTKVGRRGGGWRYVRENRYMRIRIEHNQRPSIALTGCRTDADADARCAIIAEVTAQLLAAGRKDRVKDFADELGLATSDRQISVIRKAVEQVVTTASVAPKSITFGDWANKWTRGELARLYPDHVQVKDSKDDQGKLDKYILPIVGPVPIARFSLEDAERVMSRVPAAKSRATRRHVAQVMHRVLVLAVYPGKLIERSPMPKGFLPKLGADKAKPYVYPKEDAALMACVAIPLVRRLVYGILTREGMRAGELIGNPKTGRPAMTWAEADVVVGAFRLDKNKTNDPRSWAMTPGVARALKLWQERFAPTGGPMFPGLDVSTSRGEFRGIAEQLRVDLALAVGTAMRPELLERDSSRARLKAHHLRATFVTLALANGRTETWVQDRTGHASSVMINRYRRTARTAAELGLGDLAPLDEAIPELRALKAADQEGAPAPVRGRRGRARSKRPAGAHGATMGQFVGKNDQGGRGR